MAHCQVIALQLCTVIEHNIEPVDIGLAKKVVILTGIKTNLLLELYSLGSVHHVPLAMGKVREALLCTQSDIYLFG